MQHAFRNDAVFESNKSKNNCITINLVTKRNYRLTFNTTDTYCAKNIASHHFRNTCISREPNASFFSPSLLFINRVCPKCYIVHKQAQCTVAHNVTNNKMHLTSTSVCLALSGKMASANCLVIWHCADVSLVFSGVTV